jgi:putative effector of murein hydrolase LrgA (UPF0299 family)
MFHCQTHMLLHLRRHLSPVHTIYTIVTLVLLARVLSEIVGFPFPQTFVTLVLLYILSISKSISKSIYLSIYLY